MEKPRFVIPLRVESNKGRVLNGLLVVVAVLLSFAYLQINVVEAFRSLPAFVGFFVQNFFPAFHHSNNFHLGNASSECLQVQIYRSCTASCPHYKTAAFSPIRRRVRFSSGYQLGVLRRSISLISSMGHLDFL